MQNILCLLIFFTWSISYAQHQERDIKIGKSLLIQSKIMDDQREIQIFLPENYASSNREYPVLYLLDGQRYFLQAVGLQKAFLEFQQSPDFIIVGISKKASDRNRNFSIYASKYLNFIEDEVINYIDRKYRTSEKRIIFAWAYGGGFVIEALITKPYLFESYIAASPFPLKDKVNRIDSFLNDFPALNKHLFFSSEAVDGVVWEGALELNNLLASMDSTKLDWTYMGLEDEEHRSTPYTSLYHGLRKYFYYFPELQFTSLEKFSEAGGLRFVDDYYEKRAAKYGLAREPSDWTMFSITRNAIRANDFEQFEDLLGAFRGTNFLERIRLSRACIVAEFYIQNSRFDKAIDLFQLLAKIHPDSERPLSGLGDTYKEMGDDKQASIYYEKARAVVDSSR